jgi:dihydrodipicolinate synthase/N-acetylneuraminate lyase
LIWGRPVPFRRWQPLFSEILVGIWDAAQTKDYERGKALQAKMNLVWDIIKGRQFLRRIKEMLNQIGRLE